METVGLLFLVVFRSLLLILPASVAWLAFRRLAMSETQNAWIYAATGLFAGFTFAGLMPWAVGLARPGALFFVFAAFSPAVWMAVVTIVAPQTRTRYDFDEVSEEEDTGAAEPPLILEEPEWPDAPVAVFRHHKPSGLNESGDPPRSVLAIAREMRGRRSSDKRRGPKLLPPPAEGDFDLPFVR